MTLPCSQLWGKFTHTSANRFVSFVLPRWGAGPVLLLYCLRASSPTCLRCWWGGYLTPTHVATRHMSNGDSSPILTTLGLTHPYFCQQVWPYCIAQVRCRACSPGTCSWWGTGTTFLLLPASGIDGLQGVEITIFIIYYCVWVVEIEADLAQYLRLAQGIRLDLTPALIWSSYLPLCRLMSVFTCALVLRFWWKVKWHITNCATILKPWLFLWVWFL